MEKLLWNEKISSLDFHIKYILLFFVIQRFILFNWLGSINELLKDCINSVFKQYFFICNTTNRNITNPLF